MMLPRNTTQRVLSSPLPWDIVLGYFSLQGSYLVASKNRGGLLVDHHSNPKKWTDLSVFSVDFLAPAGSMAK